MIRLKDFLIINKYQNVKILDIDTHTDMTNNTLAFDNWEVKEFAVDPNNDLIYIGVRKISQTHGKIISGVFVE